MRLIALCLALVCVLAAPAKSFAMSGTALADYWFETKAKDLKLRSSERIAREGTRTLRLVAANTAYVNAAVVIELVEDPRLGWKATLLNSVSNRPRRLALSKAEGERLWRQALGALDGRAPNNERITSDEDEKRVVSCYSEANSMKDGPEADRTWESCRKLEQDVGLNLMCIHPDEQIIEVIEGGRIRRSAGHACALTAASYVVFNGLKAASSVTEYCGSLPSLRGALFQFFDCERLKGNRGFAYPVLNQILENNRKADDLLRSREDEHPLSGTEDLSVMLASLSEKASFEMPGFEPIKGREKVA